MEQIVAKLLVSNSKVIQEVIKFCGLLHINLKMYMRLISTD